MSERTLSRRTRAAAEATASRSHAVTRQRLDELVIGRADDRAERDADRRADSAMRTPHLPVTAARFPLSTSVSAGSHGHAMPDSMRAFFEPRFGHDLSAVRIHTDREANAHARALDAQALSAGEHLYFADGALRPDRETGRELLAHELAHIVQQRESRARPVIRRRCSPPSPPFNLASSVLGQSISSALAGATIVVPSAGPGQPPTTRPRVDPATVMRLLSASNCFLRDAQAVERRFARGQTLRLNLDFHQDPALGSEFMPGRPATLRVHVTTLAQVVNRIVHEVVHASHRRMPGAGRGGGAVTRTERIGVAEEMRTRDRENEIMDEIRANPLWQQAPGHAQVRRAQSGAEQVRGSFVSGLPMITYQENFIVEEMKRRNRVTGLDEARAVRAARDMAATQGVNPVEVQFLRHFNFDVAQIQFHQRRAAGVGPVGPRSRPRIQLGPSAAQVAQSASQVFMAWFNALPAGMTTTSGAGQLQLTANGRRAMEFFAWVLIAERMSRTWQAATRRSGITGAAPTRRQLDDIRRRHLTFMLARTGGARGLLRGIRFPPTTGGRP